MALGSRFIIFTFFEALFLFLNCNRIVLSSEGNCLSNGCLLDGSCAKYSTFTKVKTQKIHQHGKIEKEKISTLNKHDEMLTNYQINGTDSLKYELSKNYTKFKSKCASKNFQKYLLQFRGSTCQTKLKLSDIKRSNVSQIETLDEAVVDSELQIEKPLSLEELDLNASISSPSLIGAEGAKGKDQLETYSQFAERVNAEKKNGESASSHTIKGSAPPVKINLDKSKNLASTACGAKLLASNPQSSHSNKIISSDKDEYMLSQCTDKIWAAVELCESIRPHVFEIANFELYSNSPKDIAVFASQRYPSREWVSLGTFLAEEGNRDVQAFQIKEVSQFFKYIKLEINSYYGSEFYCPLSMFRIFGQSEFEIIETEENDEYFDSNSNDENELDNNKVFEGLSESNSFKNENIVNVQPDSEKKKGMLPNVITSIVDNVYNAIKKTPKTGNFNETSSNSTLDCADMNNFSPNCSAAVTGFKIDSEVCSIKDFVHFLSTCFMRDYLAIGFNRSVVDRLVNKKFCRRFYEGALKPDFGIEVFKGFCWDNYPCMMLGPKHVLAICYLKFPSIQNSCRNCSKTINSEVTKVKSTKYRKKSYFLRKVLKINSKVCKLNPIHCDSCKNCNCTDNKFNGRACVNCPSVETKIKKVQDNKENLKPNENIAKTPGQNGQESIPGSPPMSESKTTSKESVVVRLSNKVKMLEHNLSISAQYLEELSRRYKAQMEDMERKFNVTIHALNVSNHKAYERDVQHHKRLKDIENEELKLKEILDSYEDWKTEINFKINIVYPSVLTVLLLIIAALLRRLSSRRRVDTTHSMNVIGNGAVKTGVYAKKRMEELGRLEKNHVFNSNDVEFEKNKRKSKEISIKSGESYIKFDNISKSLPDIVNLSHDKKLPKVTNNFKKSIEIKPENLSENCDASRSTDCYRSFNGVSDASSCISNNENKKKKSKLKQNYIGSQSPNVDHVKQNSIGPQNLNADVKQVSIGSKNLNVDDRKTDQQSAYNTSQCSKINRRDPFFYIDNTDISANHQAAYNLCGSSTIIFNQTYNIYDNINSLNSVKTHVSVYDLPRERHKNNNLDVFYFNKLEYNPFICDNLQPSSDLFRDSYQYPDDFSASKIPKYTSFDNSSTEEFPVYVSPDNSVIYKVEDRIPSELRKVGSSFYGDEFSSSFYGEGLRSNFRKAEEGYKFSTKEKESDILRSVEENSEVKTSEVDFRNVLSCDKLKFENRVMNANEKKYDDKNCQYSDMLPDCTFGSTKSDNSNRIKPENFEFSAVDRKDLVASLDEPDSKPKTHGIINKAEALFDPNSINIHSEVEGYFKNGDRMCSKNESSKFKNSTCKAFEITNHKFIDFRTSEVPVYNFKPGVKVPQNPVFDSIEAKDTDNYVQPSSCSSDIYVSSSSCSDIYVSSSCGSSDIHVPPICCSSDILSVESTTTKAPPCNKEQTFLIENGLNMIANKITSQISNNFNSKKSKKFKNSSTLKSKDSSLVSLDGHYLESEKIESSSQPSTFVYDSLVSNDLHKLDDAIGILSETPVSKESDLRSDFPYTLKESKIVSDFLAQSFNANDQKFISIQQNRSNLTSNQAKRSNPSKQDLKSALHLKNDLNAVSNPQKTSNINKNDSKFTFNSQKRSKFNKKKPKSALNPTAESGYKSTPVLNYETSPYLPLSRNFADTSLNGQNFADNSSNGENEWIVQCSKKKKRKKFDGF